MGKVKLFFKMTSEVHDDVTELYELLADDEIRKAEKLIEVIRQKLRDIKSNIIIQKNK